MKYDLNRIKDLRINQKMSFSKIATELNIGSTTVAKICNEIEEEHFKTKLERNSFRKDVVNNTHGKLDPKYSNSNSELRRRLKEKDSEIESLRNKLLIKSCGMDNIKPHDRGLIAQSLVSYKILRMGLEVLSPILPSSSYDICVKGKSGKFYKCEIKSAYNRNCVVSVVKNRYIKGEYTRVIYTMDDEIDFFVLVDLATENLYIVPFSVVNKYSKNIRLNGKGCSVIKYLEDYEQFE